MPAIIDPGQFQTDQILWDIEQQTHDAYTQAWREMEAKLEKKLASFDAARKKVEQEFLNNEITFEEYTNWLTRQTAINQNLKDIVDVLAEDMHNVNLIAAQISTGAMPDVYAVNANYAYFDVMQFADGYISAVKNSIASAFNYGAGGTPWTGLSFNLYSRETAELLLKTEWGISPEPGKNALLPKPSATKKKELAKIKRKNPDELWNAQKLQSALTQGVLQGEGPRELAKRLQSVAKMNENQAIRNARTMTTNVQNLGRQQAYLNAKDMDIDLTIQWYAIIDGVTRHSHRKMHGKTKKNNKTAKFDNGLRWPGDPAGPPGEVYNCRCSTVAWVKGYEGSVPRTNEWLKKQNITFNEWQSGMNKAKTTPTSLGVTSDGMQVFSAERKAAALKFDDINEAHKEYLPILEEQWEDLTEYEQYSAWEYTRNSNPINKSLSGYHDDWNRSSYIGPENTVWGHEDRWRHFETSEFDRKYGKDGHKDFHRAITNLTTGIDKCELRHDAWFVRGGGNGGLAGLLSGNDSLGLSYEEINGILGRKNPAEIRQLKSMVEGQVFKEHSFLSTGSAKGGGFDYKPVMYDVFAPKGTKAMYVEPTSYYGNTIGHREKIFKKGMRSLSSGYENETLFQRGSEWRINRLDFDEISGNIRVQMDCVRQPTYFQFGDEDTFNNGATRHKR